MQEVTACFNVGKEENAFSLFPLGLEDFQFQEESDWRGVLKTENQIRYVGFLCGQSTE